jgi:hypothetical protein
MMNSYVKFQSKTMRRILEQRGLTVTMSHMPVGNGDIIFIQGNKGQVDKVIDDFGRYYIEGMYADFKVNGKPYQIDNGLFHLTLSVRYHKQPLAEAGELFEREVA